MESTTIPSKPTNRPAGPTQLPRASDILLVLTVAFLYLRISLHLNSYNPINWPHEIVGPLALLSGSQSYGNFRINTGIGGEKLSADGTEFTRGIGTHATSIILTKAISASKSLSGTCIYPDYVDSGEIICSIETKSGVLFKSPALNQAHRKERFHVDIPNDRMLTLRIDSTSASIFQAHGAWVDLQEN